MVEHIVPVLQRGHAHLGAAQGLGDVLQREAIGAGRCKAQRRREQCQGHMGDQAAVVVLHGALRQCGRDFVGSDVADVVDIGLQRGVLQRIGAQPVRHIAQRGAALHGMQGQGRGQQATPQVVQAVVVPPVGGEGGELAAALVVPVPVGVSGIPLACQQQRVPRHAVRWNLAGLGQALAYQGVQPLGRVPCGRDIAQHLGGCGQCLVDQGIVQPCGRHVADGAGVLLHGALPSLAGGGWAVGWRCPFSAGHRGAGCSHGP